MSGNTPTMPIRLVAWRVAVAVLLSGFPTGASLAQQPAAGFGGSTHAAAAREGETGKKTNIPVGLSTHPPVTQNIYVQTPHFLKTGPANGRLPIPGGPGIVERNAIGVPVVRHDALPAAPLRGHLAVRPLVPQSAGGGLPVRSGEIAPVRVTVAPPVVSSRGTITGASFTRPGTTLVPIGGPAKPAATGINGSNIRPKH